MIINASHIFLLIHYVPYTQASNQTCYYSKLFYDQLILCVTVNAQKDLVTCVSMFQVKTWPITEFFIHTVKVVSLQTFAIFYLYPFYEQVYPAISSELVFHKLVNCLVLVLVLLEPLTNVDGLSHVDDINTQCNFEAAYCINSFSLWCFSKVSGIGIPIFIDQKLTNIGSLHLRDKQNVRINKCNVVCAEFKAKFFW